MKKDFHSEMKLLIEHIQKNNISTIDAINKYVDLINDHETNISNYIISFGKKEIQDRMNRKKHIQNLNRILVLQELGVFFDKEEINQLLITNKIT